MSLAYVGIFKYTRPYSRRCLHNISSGCGKSFWEEFLCDWSLDLSHIEEEMNPDEVNVSAVLEVEEAMQTGAPEDIETDDSEA